MKFPQALKAARQGKLIRREVWLNPLRMSGDTLEFVQAVQMYGKHYERDYVATEIDQLASDWQTVRA